jgi:FkbM family methyltransferase
MTKGIWFSCRADFMKIFLKKVAVALQPRSWLLTTALPDGTVVSGENKPGHGGRGVYIFGADLEYELRLLPQLISRGDVFLDIGANVGVFAMQAASIVGPTGTVLALEPFPRMADMLLRNARANHFQNVRLRVCCASSTDGHAQFWLKGDRPNAFTLIDSPGSWCYDVPTVTVDTLLQREALVPQFIKIDAEGAENLILEGARHTIASARPIILVEDLIVKNQLIPEGYQPYRYRNSHNLLLVHDESPRREKIIGLGFCAE